MPRILDEDALGQPDLPDMPAGYALITSQPPTYAGAPAVATAPTAGHAFALDSAGRIPASVPATAIQVMTADPASPVIGQIWYRSDTSQLCVRHNSSTTKRTTLA